MIRALGNLTAADGIQIGPIKDMRGQTYRGILRSAVFCINPLGHGWGLRIVPAATWGCIPIMLQDGVYQPWEDLLPYRDFSLRFRFDEIKDMVASLRAMEPERVLEMYRALRKVHKAFVWPRRLGGTAYAMTIASLHSRLQRFQGAIY